MHLLYGKKTIGYKWIFVVKMNFDAFVARLKAQLVIKGLDTFSFVAKLTSMHLFISLVATYN